MSDNRWFKIWVKPRETIQKIVEQNPNSSLWLLAAIYGFSSLLNLFQSMDLGLQFTPLVLVILAFVFSPFWGYIVFSVWSWFVSFTGKWLKGKGAYTHIRAAYAWSCVPLLFNVAFWLILVALFGERLFIVMPQEPMPQVLVLFLFILLIAKVVLAIWSLVIYINALAQVQQFSILRAIGNILIAAIFLTILFAVLWTAAMQLIGVNAPAIKFIKTFEPVVLGGGL